VAAHWQALCSLAQIEPVAGVSWSCRAVPQAKRRFISFILSRPVTWVPADPSPETGIFKVTPRDSAVRRSTRGFIKGY
jgi:hypothetical protein